MYAPLRDFILALADIRNAAAHKPLSDAELEEQFVSVWKQVSGGAPWPDALPVRSKYCRAMFSLIAFELQRWQVALPPSGYFSGEQKVDWDYFAK